MPDTKVGYFVFSLDTELGTGYFDNDRKRAAIFSPDGSRERWAIRSLLDLMDEYDIRATWAIVGHLFYKNCEHCDICPIMDWKGKYRSFDEAYDTSHPLWYGADVVQEILKRSRHEIGFHGYSHRVFNPETMSPEDARIEAQEWLRVAGRKGIIAKSITFPRGACGYLNILKEFGFTSYRSQKPVSIWIRNRYFGLYLEIIDHLLAITTPPSYLLNEMIPNANGMIPIPASTHLFRFPRRLELLLDNYNLHLLRIRRILKGIHKAAEENKFFHLWAHPWEFRTQNDIEKIRHIFEAVAQEIKRGRMQSVTMFDLANKVINCP